MSSIEATPPLTAVGALLTALTLVVGPRAPAPDHTVAVSAKLSEWKVELSAPTVAAGTVTFTIVNEGSIPHAFEVEGEGIERETAVIQPGSKVTLAMALGPGRYDVYCPVGDDSHKKLGMETHLTVVGTGGAHTASLGGTHSGLVHPETNAAPAVAHPTVQSIHVAGNGPVIQILPGPFPFPDSAAPVLKQFGAEQHGLESQIKNGPYSNQVALISGTFTFTAWDKGATRDSVDGVAEFITHDNTRWRLVLDRVQTHDVPHRPRFGGVILGLYYHGNTGVHTPLVPTIRSSVALWAFGHLYRNGALVTDSAMTHVMLLSHTRRPPDFALDCWDCSKNPIDELQLQILPGTKEPPFDAPGGFLFVNWEQSSGTALDRRDRD